MVDWDKSKIKISDLYLDDANLRLPLFRSEQDVLIKELVDDEDVFEILESIITHGYYKHIDLIVVKEDGKYIVMDGNRRLTSCKIIMKSPDVPDKILQRADKEFRQKLIDFDTNTIAELYVSIAPSREEVYPYIHTIHTQDLSKNWNPSSLALSIKTMLEHGKSLTEIEKKYKLTRDQINEYIVLAEVYEIIVDQSSSIKVPKDSIRKFDFETLKNIYSSKPGSMFLNIKIKEDKIEYKGNIATSHRAFNKIAYDIYQTGMVFNKSKSDEKKISQYLDRIKEEYGAGRKLTRSNSNQSSSTNIQTITPLRSHPDSLSNNHTSIATDIISPVTSQITNTPTNTPFDNSLFDEVPLFAGNGFQSPIQNRGEININQQQNNVFPIIARENSFEAENCFAKIRQDTANSNIDKKLKDIALYDLEEAFKSYKAEAYKASIVMIGAFLEGIMLATFLDKTKDEVKSKESMSQQDIEKALAKIKTSFEKLIHITKSHISLDDNLLINVQKSRNLIHPWKTYIGDIELDNSYTRFLNSLTSLALTSKKILEYKF